MEPKFENRYVRSLAVAQEFSKHSYLLHPARLILLIAGFALMAFSLVMIGFLIVRGNIDAISPYIIALVVSFALVFILFAIYRNLAKNLIERECTLNGGRLSEVYTAATEEKIICQTATGGVTEIPYSQLKNAKVTENLILVYMQANMCFILNKHGFTRGTADGFIAFLESRGVRVK